MTQGQFIGNLSSAVKVAERVECRITSLLDFLLHDVSEGCRRVFLPAAGYRNGTNVNNVGSNGNYWSASYNNQNNANNLNFNSGNANMNNNNRYNGNSVRLVRVSLALSLVSLCII